MSSANELIQDAYTELLVHSALKPVSEFAVDFARRKFQAMMQEWIDDDMDFGFSATEFVSDETSIPLGLHTAITTNLAVRLAPSVGKVANPTLLANASVSLQIVRDQYQSKEAADRIVSGTMPTGQGNARGLKPPIFANADFVLSDGVVSLRGSAGGGGSGGGIPGPPGPPGPQGPPGDEVFASQQEVLDGIVNDKSVAPDTLQGKFNAPGIIGGTVPAQQILVGRLDLTTDFMLGTVLNTNIGIIPLGTGRIVLKDFTTPSVAPVPTEILQVIDGFGNTDWKLPHVVLNLTGGGDLVFNSGNDILTRLPIGAVDQVLESTGSLPEWRSPVKGGGRNYIIDGDFGESFATVMEPGDNTYIAPLIHYIRDNSAARFTVERNASTTLGASSVNRPAASLKITITTPETTTPNDGRLSLIYDIAGSNFSPLPNRDVVLSFRCESSVSGTFYAAFTNGLGGRNYIQQFDLVANVEKLVELPLVADVIGNPANWTFTDNTIGMVLLITLASGADFQENPVNLNKWLSNGLISAEDQTNFAATNGATFEITHLTFEEGTKSRTFVPLERALVIKQIEWYLERWDFNSFSDEFAFSGNYEGTTGFQLVLPFRTKKRVAPVNGKSLISLFGTWNMDVLATTLAVTSISIINNSSANSILIEGSTIATTAGAGCSLKRKATSTAFVVIDSRHR